MKKTLLITLLFIGTILNSNAQESTTKDRNTFKYYWSFNWEISKGLGETKNFIEGISFRGGSVDGRYFIREKVTVGGFIALYTLYDESHNEPPYEIELDGLRGDILGTQVRYLNTLPVFANIHYYLNIGEDIKVYGGLGLGAIYVEQRTELGIKSIKEDSWTFGGQPEIGVYIKMGEQGSGINLSARYLYGSSVVDLNSISMLTFAIGFGIMQ